MLMLSLYRSQRRGDALEVFGRTRSVLVAELGIEPGPYLQRLQRAILADDPSLVSEAAFWLSARAGNGQDPPAPSARPVPDDKFSAAVARPLPVP